MQRYSLRLRSKKVASSQSSSHLSSQFHAMSFQNPGYEHGDTLLHLAIRKCDKITVVDDLIRDIGLDVVSAMSVITNDEGDTPVDLLDDVSIIDGDAIDTIFQQLTNIMKTYPVKPLNATLCAGETAESMGSQINKRLNDNLRMAVNLLNQVRQLIKQSATHPSYNNFIPGEQKRVSKLISKARQFMSYQPVTEDDIANISYYAARYACGNCYEFSYAVLDLLRKQHPGVSAEVVVIKNGDHVFVVIERQPRSDIANSATWGESCVVCDAWSGEVYPADQLPYKLMNFSRYFLGTDVNVLHTYNPRFHAIAVQQKIQGKKTHNSGLFKSDLRKKRTIKEDDTFTVPPGKKRSHTS